MSAKLGLAVGDEESIISKGYATVTSRNADISEDKLAVLITPDGPSGGVSTLVGVENVDDSIHGVVNG